MHFLVSSSATRGSQMALPVLVCCGVRNTADGLIEVRAGAGRAVGGSGVIAFRVRNRGQLGEEALGSGARRPGVATQDRNHREIFFYKKIRLTNY